ncbi:membrane protein insertase YidC [bacterium]|nr:membrane protein insertase YidC [bacterium]
MDQQRRLLLFFTVSLAILIGWSQFVVPMLFPRPLPVPGDFEELAAEDGPASALFPENLAAILEAEAVPNAPLFEKHEPTTVMLGSPDPASGYFLSVKLTSRGAAVETVELNDPRYPEFGMRGKPLTLIGHDPLVAQKSLATLLPKIDEQLEGSSLEEIEWKLLPEGTSASAAAFQIDFPKLQLRLTKSYDLTKVTPAENATYANDGRDTVTQGYQLHLTQTIENLAAEPQKVSYTLRGPVSLPLEDPQNISKFRDLRLGFLREGDSVDHTTFFAKTAVEQFHEAEEGPVFDPTKIEVWKRPIQYIGVDTQYFAALVQPLGDQWKSPTIESSQAVVITEGTEPQFSDVSVLLTSPEIALGAAGAADGSAIRRDEYQVYLGPKREALLAPFQAQPIMDYGMFAPVVRIMLVILHTLHAAGLSYGIAILALTCLVRGAMIPVTLHQARSMDKMKELQPKIKVLHEKYKKDPQSLTAEEMRQMQEVNLKMFAGCLPLLLQMPIFISLYQSLQHSVDLRMAPFHLMGSWIDNLASPDKLFALGFALPFVGWTTFNLLPIVSVLLMQMNQKLTMPPPADEEQAMQYRMMNIMMYVMIIFFYRVPSGLCLYFIMSSIWGTSERLLMKRFAAKKTNPPGSGDNPAPTPAPVSPAPKTGDAPEKPSIFADFKAKLKELQEMADKEGSIRNENNGQGSKSKKQRGRR